MTLLSRTSKSPNIITITLFFFFNDTATTEIYTLSLHDALPISARGLRDDRRHAHGSVGGQERVDRLAVPPAVRLRRLLRGAPRRRDERAVAPVSDGELPDAAPLPRGHPRPRDRARNGDRVRPRHGLHDAAPGAGPGRATRPRHAWGRLDALGAAPAIRLRAGRSVAPSGTAKRHGRRRAGRGRTADRRAA